VLIVATFFVYNRLHPKAEVDLTDDKSRYRLSLCNDYKVVP